jgi:beta-N-acetylhexosaminidase
MKRLGTAEHKAWATECADKGITLVKREEGVLPISPDKYKKVLLYDIESEQSFFEPVKVSVAETFQKLLEGEGFSMERFNPNKGMEGMMMPYSAVTGQYDLILYLVRLTTKSNQTVVRIEWAQPMGANVPIYMTSVPTIFISVANPYHLLDAPRVRTYINAYHYTDVVLQALVDKLVGRSEFKGTSPVDAFCGMWDTRL